MREMINAYKMLVGKPERKRPLERPRHTLKDNIKILTVDNDIISFQKISGYLCYLIRKIYLSSFERVITYLSKE
jgi:hypothetical protein